MKSFIRIFLIIHTFYFLALEGFGQDVQFSQFHQTPLLTNPAMVASDDVMKIDLQYRSQSIGAGGQAFVTPALSIAYPLISKKTGNRWGGIGAMVLQDQAGLEGILQTTGGALAFGYNFKIKPGNYISIGAQGGFYQRALDETKLTTGNQFVTGTPDLGENLQNLNTTFLTVESGLFWHMEDTATRTRRAYIGFSARQINQADINFTEVGGSQLPLTLVATAGVRVFRSNQFEVVPNGRFIQAGASNQINVGSSFRYLFGQSVSEEGVYTESSIGLNTWYSLNNAVIAGIEVNYKKLFTAFSYDFNFANPDNRSLANGAMEFMIGYRKDMGYKRLAQPDTTSKEPDNIITERPNLLPITDSTSLEYEDPRNYNLTDLQFNLIQRAILFPYNQSELTDGTKLFLDRVAALLKAHPDMKLEISGHASDEGSSQSNTTIAENRAIEVYNYLVLRGIEKNRLYVRGYSNTRPIANNNIEAGRIRNRRVEIRVAKPAN